jgi:hypothetical protein
MSSGLELVMFGLALAMPYIYMFYIKIESDYWMRELAKVDSISLLRILIPKENILLLL